ncbi:SDR family NAD(P)-dependent oxidoreductase [Rhodobacteraceae bacterium NNCM2]|nr:SDR family NAD(P)-dependent oxidoreductase [Coraliihabitans acroporae]
MKLGNDIAAIVTGGASGLGEATARRLADSGVRVTIFDMDTARGEAVAAEIGGAFAAVDVSDPASVAAGIEAARAAHGQERITVNCAGIAPAGKTVGREGAHDPALFAKVIQVNLIGTFNVASASAAGMVGAEPLDADGARGVIVNTASVAAYEGQVGQIAYASSKGGVASLTLPMARDLARDGVRVVAIAPGLFGTPMLRGLPEEVQQSLGQQVPFPSRLGEPSEYAALVAHIAENTMLNGEVIRLDGAIRMAPR